MLTLVENDFLHEHLLVMSSRSAKYGAFLRTGGRGTSRPRYALQYRQLELLQGIAQCHCTQVIMIVRERMLELNCFYSLLCLTEIIFLQSSLNIHLIRIALAYCGTLASEEGRALRGGQEFRCLKKTKTIGNRRLVPFLIPLPQRQPRLTNMKFRHKIGFLLITESIDFLAALIAHPSFGIRDASW